jgi:hypothetical protein
MGTEPKRGHTIEEILSVSQEHISRPLAAAEQAVAAWCAAPHDPAVRLQATSAVHQLQTTVDQHFARIAGEGLLEDAVSAKPALYPRMRELESWQNALCDKLEKITEDLQDPAGEDYAGLIASALAGFRQELLQEEGEERKIIDLGLH